MPGAAPPHPGDEAVGEHHRRPEIDVEHAVDVLDTLLLEQARARQTGVGDQDVDVVVIREQPLEAVAVGEVDGDCLRRDLGGQRLEDLCPATAQDQPGAAASERAGHGMTETSGGSGEQDLPAVDAHDTLTSAAAEGAKGTGVQWPRDCTAAPPHRGPRQRDTAAY